MKIDVNIPDKKIGNWAVKSFTVSKEDALIFNMRAIWQPGARRIKPGTYKKLTKNGTIIMSNTPAEIRDHSYFLHIAKGDILINGLGLGVAVKYLLGKKEVKSITVIEKSQDVIQLVAPHLNDPRLNIIHADAFEWKSPKGMQYDYVWHDIWDNICSDNLPEMHKLHRKYGRKSGWQGSWVRELCERNR